MATWHDPLLDLVDSVALVGGEPEEVRDDGDEHVGHASESPDTTAA